MARDQSGGVHSSARERAAAARAGRKCLGADGRPQPAPARDAADPADGPRGGAGRAAPKPRPSGRE
jgi:hypothetical protein